MVKISTDQIIATLRSAGIPADLITESADGQVRVPGLTICWDRQDPENEGWAYRTAEESGFLDTLEDVEELAAEAASLAGFGRSPRHR